MDSINYSSIAEQLLNVLPEFQEIYQEMLDYYGEIFPYLLIGSGLVKFTVKNYEIFQKSQGEDLKSGDILKRIVDFLESCALSKDEDVIELIRIGFMEHLDSNSASFNGLVSILKPESKKLLKEAKNI
ncbi:MAG: hypothetical protein LCI00_10175 [Chloroflexi bacterium]|nr:hypothetical protein [Chloroflexota bacterium]MCC6892907.1 hypothetical protein [Anaerolineae bacterium]